MSNTWDDHAVERRQAERVGQSVAGRGRITFREAIALAEEQVGIAEVARYERSWSVLHDMCRVMAEVYMAPPSMLMKVCGEEMEAGLVAEVYRELTADCVQELAHRLTQEIGGVRFIKAYLRSALYNAAFEYESSAARELSADWGC